MWEAFYKRFLDKKAESILAELFMKAHEDTFNSHHMGARALARTYKSLVVASKTKRKADLNDRGKGIMNDFLTHYSRVIHDSSNFDSFMCLILDLQINSLKNAI